MLSMIIKANKEGSIHVTFVGFPDQLHNQEFLLKGVVARQEGLSLLRSLRQPPKQPFKTRGRLVKKTGPPTALWGDFPSPRGIFYR